MPNTLSLRFSLKRRGDHNAVSKCQSLPFIELQELVIHVDFLIHLIVLAFLRKNKMFEYFRHLLVYL